MDIPLVDPPHDKFTLVLSISPKAYFVFINSEINKYIKARPPLLNAQVTIDQSSHKFLDYDSYIDCSNPFYQGGQDLDSILQQLAREPSRRKGFCSNTVLGQVLEALDEAKTVSRQIRDAARGGLGPLLDSAK